MTHDDTKTYIPKPSIEERRESHIWRDQHGRVISGGQVSLKLFFPIMMFS